MSNPIVVESTRTTPGVVRVIGSMPAMKPNRRQLAALGEAVYLVGLSPSGLDGVKEITIELDLDLIPDERLGVTYGAGGGGVSRK